MLQQLTTWLWTMRGLPPPQVCARRVLGDVQQQVFDETGLKFPLQVLVYRPLQLLLHLGLPLCSRAGQEWAWVQGHVGVLDCAGVMRK